MTLHKAIEAAREGLTINLNRFMRPVRKVSDGHDMDDDQYDTGWNNAVKKIEPDYVTEVTLKLAWEKRAYQAEKELADIKATLPAKPLTEDEIWKIAIESFDWNESMTDVIRALRDAGVLYVAESGE